MPKKETPESRKSQIIAAADLVLLEVGINRFTVDQVIQRAGIAKGTVYNYYKHKDEMLAELGFKSLRLLRDSFAAGTAKHDSAIHKVKAICHACYQYYMRYPKYFELIAYMERPEFQINTQEYIRISEEIQGLTEGIIKQGQAQKEIRHNLNSTMANYILWASCVGVVGFVESKKKLLKNYHEIDTSALVEAFADMITEGMAA